MMYKHFKYRIYPTIRESIRLQTWLSSTRYLWNLGNEQRLNGLRSGVCRYVTYLDQQKELTDLRREISWLMDVPRHVADNLLAQLDKAWQRCFNKISGRPKFKSRGTPIQSLTESDPAQFRLSASHLKFPKLPPIRAVVHRPLEGKPKTCTIKREGDHEKQESQTPSPSEE